MGCYTLELRELNKNDYDIAMSKYPIFSEEYRQYLNDLIYEYYYSYEIGVDTPAAFFQRLSATMKLKMKKFNRKYIAQLEMDRDWKSTIDIVNTATEQENSKSVGNSENNSVNSGSSTSINTTDNISENNKNSITDTNNNTNENSNVVNSATATQNNTSTSDTNNNTNSVTSNINHTNSETTETDNSSSSTDTENPDTVYSSTMTSDTPFSGGGASVDAHGVIIYPNSGSDTGVSQIVSNKQSWDDNTIHQQTMNEDEKTINSNTDTTSSSETNNINSSTNSAISNNVSSNSANISSDNNLNSTSNIINSANDVMTAHNNALNQISNNNTSNSANINNLTAEKSNQNNSYQHGRNISISDLVEKYQDVMSNIDEEVIESIHKLFLMIY